MAYIINASDRNIVVEQGTLNKETSLDLVGKEYFGYGEAIAQNFVSLLENHAGDTAPRNPTKGQIWYDTSVNMLKFYDGGDWTGLASDARSVLDSTNVSHDVFIISAEGLPVATFYPNEEFTLHVSETALLPHFQNGIKKGITLASGMKMHGTATEAEYADLAEMYSSDANYEPGTVVKIGGEEEITQTTSAFCSEVFGIISTNPAHLMNSQCEGTALPVALEGRVPCKVIGEVKKGQRLVSSETPGVARAVTDYERMEGLDWYRVVGRAIEDKTTLGVGLCEVVVGVK